MVVYGLVHCTCGSPLGLGLLLGGRVANVELLVLVLATLVLFLFAGLGYPTDFDTM